MATFADRSIIVTGAGSGIGRVTAQLLAEAGAAVTVVDIDGDAAAATARLIRGAGGAAQSVTTDLTREDKVATMVERAVAWRGRLDGAANCAGRSGTHSKRLHELTVEEWRASIDVNLTSMFLCLKYQLPALLAAGGGAIVAVSSIGAIKANPRICEYAAAKAGMLGLVRNAALEYGAQGIRVNAVLPGAVETPMFARTLTKMSEETKRRVAAQHFVGRWGRSEEIAATIRWLLSPEASFITGTAVPVDGGSSAG